MMDAHPLAIPWLYDIFACVRVRVELMEHFDEDKLFLLAFQEPDDSSDQSPAATEESEANTSTNNLITEAAPPTSPQ